MQGKYSTYKKYKIYQTAPIMVKEGLLEDYYFVSK